MSSMKLDDYQSLKKTFELAGLNDKQVQHLLQQVDFVVRNALYEQSKAKEAQL